MRTPLAIFKNYVSKRDAHTDFNWTPSLAVFLFAFTVFSLSAKADDRSKTEADGVCIDCVVASLSQSNSNNQFKDFKAINVAIFSADPTGQSFIDPREQMDRTNPDNKQLNAIGLIIVTGTLDGSPKNDPSKNLKWQPGSKATGYGTGFLINNCLVITNQHVASLEDNAKYAKDLKITFSAGSPSANGNSKFFSHSEGKVVAQGPYSGGNDINNDWAIIKLDIPIGQTTGYIQPILGAADLAVKIPVSSASFYSDKGDTGQLWGQKKCSVFEDLKNSTDMLTNCPALPGTSGSPVFAQNPETKQIVALGIIQGGTTSTNEKVANASNANKMVLFSKAFTQEQLQKIIAANQCSGVSI